MLKTAKVVEDWNKISLQKLISSVLTFNRQNRLLMLPIRPVIITSTEPSAHQRFVARRTRTWIFNTHLHTCYLHYLHNPFTKCSLKSDASSIISITFGAEQISSASIFSHLLIRSLCGLPILFFQPTILKHELSSVASVGGGARVLDRLGWHPPCRGDTRSKKKLWVNLQRIVDKRGRTGKNVWGENIRKVPA